jgi:hypothetical protein
VWAVVYNRGMDLLPSILLRRLSCAAPCLALLLLGLAACLLPASSRAAEPVYAVTFANKSRMVVTLAEGRGPGGERTVRVVSVPPTVTPYDTVVDARLTMGADGVPAECAVTSGPVATPRASNLALVRTDRREDPAQFDIVSPKRSGATPFSGRLTTLLTAPAMIGRQYDWKRKGTQEFLVLVERGVPEPQFLPLTLTADGADRLELKEGPVQARRLRYKAPFPFLSEAQQTGVLYIGPRGEVLQCDTPLLATPIKATGPMHPYEREDGAFELTLEVPDGVTIRERYLGAGRHEVATEALGGLKIAKAVTNARWEPIEIESPLMGQPLQAKIANGAVTWEMEAAPLGKATVAGGAVWVWPLFFIADAWEGSGGPFSALAIGQERRGTYYPLLHGQAAGVEFTLTRRDDVRVPNPAGGDIALFSYRFTSGGVTQDLYTDGRRLVHLTASDGGSITRQGWEKAAARLATAPPPPPAKAPEKP